MESKFIGKCIELNELGQGIVYYDNKMIIVDNLLVDEEAEIIITKKTYKYYLGRVNKLLKSSNKRINVKCSSKCGGCNLIHMDYNLQIEYKNKLFKDLFKDFPTLDIIKADNNYHYRNKVIYALKYTSSNIYFGLYEENSHKIIETKNCLINNKNSEKIISKVKTYLLNNHITSVKYILMRFNSFNDVLLGIITDKDLINENELINDLKENVASIIINYNDFNTNKILSDSNKIIYGNWRLLF